MTSLPSPAPRTRASSAPSSASSRAQLPAVVTVRSTLNGAVSTWPDVIVMVAARKRSRRRQTLWLASAAILILFAFLLSSCGESAGSSGASGEESSASSSTGGPPPDPIIGQSCMGVEECDDKTYCYSDDRDCGRGHCRERPSSSHGDRFQMYCGCDGNLYNDPNAAPFAGIDVGKNTRCQTTPGVNWRCGDQILCGSKPCKNPASVCDPANVCNGYNEVGFELCLHSQEYGYYCQPLGFVTTSCDDKRILDACNGCVTPCMPGESTHDFSSFTCTEDACQLRTVECIK
jgi:hypothetical protein